MLSQVAERIYEQLKQLTKERGGIQAQIKRVHQARDNDKKALHHTEFNILSESGFGHSSGAPDIRLANELRELNKERISLHDDEKLLNGLTARYKELAKTIDHYQFWMHRADTTDPGRQREAERAIFG